MNHTKTFKIVGLPGDGIGPEIYAAAMEVFARLDELFTLQIEVEEFAIGGHAYDECGEPLPATTLAACHKADAILLGAVGGPKWAEVPKELRPEQGLLALRKALNLYANIRPVSIHQPLKHLSPLKEDRINDVDLLIVRELTGGLYFGEKQRYENSATDLCEYSVIEIERIARIAFELARKRNGKVSSVDKSNVLETSRLWREVVSRLHKDEYSDVELEHQLVDSAAMHLIAHPKQFDVILTENLFGDILSDEASMISGSLGVLPSASMSNSDPANSVTLYEPIHGSAPDIAGHDLANPTAMLLSLAMLLRHSLGRDDVAQALENAIYTTWESGIFTKDLSPENYVSTTQFTHTVLASIIAKRAYPNTMLRYV